MKKIQILGLSIILISLGSCNSKEKQNDLLEYNLHGNVKSIHLRAYNAEEKFGEVVKSNWDRSTDLDAYLWGDEFVSFNPEGFKTQVSQFYSSDILHHQDDYTYGDYGIDQIEKRDSIGNQYIYQRYFYNKKDLLHEIQLYELNGDAYLKIEYRYNEQGLLIEEKFKYDDNSGKIIRKEYDDNNNLIQESTFNIMTGNLVEKTTSEYLDGLLINKTIYSGKGTIDRTVENIYNKSGGLLEMIEVTYRGLLPDYMFSKYAQHSHFNENGDILKIATTHLDDPDYIRIEEFKYDYDQEGNWIRKLEYDNGLIKHVYEREIEYYGFFKPNDKRKEIHLNTEDQLNSQEKPKIQESWNSFEIVGIGSISIPPSMEIRQDDSFIAAVAEDLRKTIRSQKIEMVKSTLIFQPKGTNDSDADALKKYSRIIVNIERGNKGDYFKRDEKFNFNETEKRELNSIMLSQTKEELRKINIEILEWSPIEFPKISDLSTFKITYSRQLSDNYPVEVTIYKFFDDDKMVEITLSYRETEKELWKVDFDEVIHTFKIF